jgi:hypothetical protein
MTFCPNTLGRDSDDWIDQTMAPVGMAPIGWTHACARLRFLDRPYCHVPEGQGKVNAAAIEAMHARSPGRRCNLFLLLYGIIKNLVLMHWLP